MAIIHDPIAEEFFDDNCERDDVYGEVTFMKLKDFMSVVEKTECVELRDKNGSRSLCPENWIDWGLMDCAVVQIYTTQDEFFNFPIIVIVIDGEMP